MNTLSSQQVRQMAETEGENRAEQHLACNSRDPSDGDGIGREVSQASSQVLYSSEDESSQYNDSKFPPSRPSGIQEPMSRYTAEEYAALLKEAVNTTLPPSPDASNRNLEEAATQTHSPTAHRSGSPKGAHKHDDEVDDTDKIEINPDETPANQCGDDLTARPPRHLRTHRIRDSNPEDAFHEIPVDEVEGKAHVCERFFQGLEDAGTPDDLVFNALATSDDKSMKDTKRLATKLERIKSRCSGFLNRVLSRKSHQKISQEDDQREVHRGLGETTQQMTQDERGHRSGWHGLKRALSLMPYRRSVQDRDNIFKPRPKLGTTDPIPPCDVHEEWEERGRPRHRRHSLSPKDSREDDGDSVGLRRLESIGPGESAGSLIYYRRRTRNTESLQGPSLRRKKGFYHPVRPKSSEAGPEAEVDMDAVVKDDSAGNMASQRNHPLPSNLTLSNSPRHSTKSQTAPHREAPSLEADPAPRPNEGSVAEVASTPCAPLLPDPSSPRVAEDVLSSRLRTSLGIRSQSLSIEDPLPDQPRLSRLRSEGDQALELLLPHTLDAYSTPSEARLEKADSELENPVVQRSLPLRPKAYSPGASRLPSSSKASFAAVKDPFFQASTLPKDSSPRETSLGAPGVRVNTSHFQETPFPTLEPTAARLRIITSLFSDTPYRETYLTPTSSVSKAPLFRKSSLPRSKFEFDLAKAAPRSSDSKAHLAEARLPSSPGDRINQLSKDLRREMNDAFGMDGPENLDFDFETSPLQNIQPQATPDLDHRTAVQQASENISADTPDDIDSHGRNRAYPWNRVTTGRSRFRRENRRRFAQDTHVNAANKAAEIETVDLQKVDTKALMENRDNLVRNDSDVYPSFSRRLRKHMKSRDHILPTFQSLRIRPHTASNEFSLAQHSPEPDPFCNLDSSAETKFPDIASEPLHFRTPAPQATTSRVAKNFVTEIGNLGIERLPRRLFRSPSDDISTRPPYNQLGPEWLRQYHQRRKLESDAEGDLQPLGITHSVSWGDPAFRKFVLETRKREARERGHLMHGGTPSDPDGGETTRDVPRNASMAQFVAEMSRSRLEGGRKEGRGKKTPAKRRGFGGKTKPGEDKITSPGDLNNVLQQKLEYVRQVTGTQVILHSPDGPKPARGEHDARNWDAKNLRCIECTAECPVCQKPCCVYETARRISTGQASGARQREEARRLLTVIDRLGPVAKDVSTFSKCSVPGGCGRFVCPECCGACPVIGCRDIQCKECKPDPWAPCDWHE